MAAIAKNATRAFVTLAMAMANSYLARSPPLAQIRAQQMQGRHRVWRGKFDLASDQVRLPAQWRPQRPRPACLPNKVLAARQSHRASPGFDFISFISFTGSNEYDEDGTALSELGDG